jgi:monovalent cation/hydrogen antiporter
MVIMATMLMLEWVLVLLLAAVVLTNLAERLAVPYPSLLAIAGAGLAFLPFAPQIRVEPDLALVLFVAPALLDAAFDTSPRGLRDNAIPVASMAVVAVVLTTAAIAFLGWRFAGLPIAAAVALGAIVAPPDAVAANEVLRHLRIPQRIGLVLQGESMLNDATALLIYRTAVLTAAGVIQSDHRRTDAGARGCGGPGRGLCACATVWSQARLCTIRPAVPFYNSLAPLGCGFFPSA